MLMNHYSNSIELNSRQLAALDELLYNKQQTSAVCFYAVEGDDVFVVLEHDNSQFLAVHLILADGRDSLTSHAVAKHSVFDNKWHAIQHSAKQIADSAACFA